MPPLLSLTYFHLVGICVFWVLTNFGASWNSRKRQRRCVKDGWEVGWAQEGLDEEEVHNGELVSVRESLVTMGERSERTTHRLLRTPLIIHHLWRIVSASQASATANSSFSYWHTVLWKWLKYKYHQGGLTSESRILLVIFPNCKPFRLLTRSGTSAPCGQI